MSMSNIKLFVFRSLVRVVGRILRGTDPNTRLEYLYYLNVEVLERCIDDDIYKQKLKRVNRSLSRLYVFMLYGSKRMNLKTLMNNEIEICKGHLDNLSTLLNKE